MANQPPEKIFICYSQKNKEWRERISRSLKVQRLQDKVWSDQLIEAGDEWRSEIEEVLARTKVALLLLSEDFFCSDFILKVELPHFMKAHKEKQLRIIWFPVGHVDLSAYKELTKIQAAWAGEPLDEIEEKELKRVLSQIAITIREQYDAFVPVPPASVPGLPQLKSARELVEKELREIMAHPSWKPFLPYLTAMIGSEAKEPEAIVADMIGHSDLPHVVHSIALAVREGSRDSAHRATSADAIRIVLRKGEEAVGWLVHLSINPEWLEANPGIAREIAEGKTATLIAKYGFVGELVVAHARKKRAGFCANEENGLPDAPFGISFDGPTIEVGAEIEDLVQHVLKRVFSKVNPDLEVPDEPVNVTSLNERVRRMHARGKHPHARVLVSETDLPRAVIDEVARRLPDFNILYFSHGEGVEAILIEDQLSEAIRAFFEDRNELLNEII